MNTETFAKTIKEKMDEKGLNADALADKAGVSRRTVYHIIEGRPSSLSILQKVCRVLSLTIKIEEK